MDNFVRAGVMSKKGVEQTRSLGKTRTFQRVREKPAARRFRGQPNISIIITSPVFQECKDIPSKLNDK